MTYVPQKNGRPATHRSAIDAALSSSTNPIGMLRDDLVAATGLAPRVVTETLGNWRRVGGLFVLGSGVDTRYFSSAEARDAAVVGYKEWLMLLQKERSDRAKETARKSARKAWAKKRDSIRAERDAVAPVTAKPAKSKAPAKRKAVDAPVTVKAVKHSSFKSLPAANPNNVKPTICPPFVPRTFAPPPFFKGELLREWHELRSTSREAA